MRSSYLKELEANISKYENQEKSSEFWYVGVFVANLQGFSDKCVEQFKLAHHPLILCIIDPIKKQLTSLQYNHSFQTRLRQLYPISKVELITKKDWNDNGIVLIQQFIEKGETQQRELNSKSELRTFS